MLWNSINQRQSSYRKKKACVMIRCDQLHVLNKCLHHQISVCKESYADFFLFKTTLIITIKIK